MSMKKGESKKSEMGEILKALIFEKITLFLLIHMQLIVLSFSWLL